MVHIKRIALTNFKSFGGTTEIPMLPGFTVVSGPNGSGKSNILDALMFGLGLSTSKGMRAERLPDLVNHKQSTRGRSVVEASVSVTFDLAEGLETGGEEWMVTRRLRVTQQGTYTSSFYMNGEPCTLGRLHEELSRLRVYPEGYNVVLQGDVTGIISMNPRSRREIIDELAGVAAFDRKIVQTKKTLDEVKEREDRCRIVETELTAQRDRLANDRVKAEKYQKLKLALQQKSEWETVLVWRLLRQQQEKLAEQIAAGEQQDRDLQEQLTALAQTIQQAEAELEQLNARVKALGEEEQLGLQATLATDRAEQRQLQQQQQALAASVQALVEQAQRTEAEIQAQQCSLAELAANQEQLQQRIASVLVPNRDRAQQSLEQQREAASAIANASEAWVQEQTRLSRQVQTLLQALDPQRQEQARLRERVSQLERQIAEQTPQSQQLEQELASKRTQITELEETLAAANQQVDKLAQSLVAAEQEMRVQGETQTRLLQEQRQKQRQLDKLEAQAQAQQEAQGTHATRLILQAGLPGVCGLVAQLGRVEPRYQLALEIAAGGRLGHLVVEDDGVAAAGIELLKQKRAGRATFLPLNKIRGSRSNSRSFSLQQAEGFIDYAINLIECDPRYDKIFAYVFGQTVVFASLNPARRYLGQYRMVTLEGELLETSGAMTGGSRNPSRYSIHFGTAETQESDEMATLKQRLQEIEAILSRCGAAIDRATAAVKERDRNLTEHRQQQRELKLQVEQGWKEVQRLETQLQQVRSQLQQNTTELASAQTRLKTLEQTIPQQETQLKAAQAELTQLEQSQTPSEWQQIQATIREQENQLQQQEQTLRVAEQQLKDLENQQLRLQEKQQQAQQNRQKNQAQQIEQTETHQNLQTQQATLEAKIAQTKAALESLEERLGIEKGTRDRAEKQLQQHRLKHQETEWQRQKLHETQQTRRTELIELQTQLKNQRLELPEPLPEVPENLNLEQLQRELRSGQKRLQSMEPVNMLALEEYDRTQARLEELSQKLATLEEERTELLLRIENFTTLRQRAFKEAFDAINQNFQSIFANLSQGDGYLQLDDPKDPFNSGLNLVAHPKGKPVQRLASMSGGEKSLTALSFIFSLQRYRPSPFYAFDEVDMFLDGANVERLSKMIEHQAKQAQFIVVSLRRPMIESAERTIGVTQARGAYTQVLGIKLQPQNTA